MSKIEKGHCPFCGEAEHNEAYLILTKSRVPNKRGIACCLI